jgi:integrase
VRSKRLVAASATLRRRHRNLVVRAPATPAHPRNLASGPVETRVGNRDLPIPAMARAALLARQAKQAINREVVGASREVTGLVFTTRTGRPSEPRNLDRTFIRICEQQRIRVIAVHYRRHTTASLLKKLHVPPRDAQMTLGHSHFSSRMQIYTHLDEQSRNEGAHPAQRSPGDRRLTAPTVVRNGGRVLIPRPNRPFCLAWWAQLGSNQ